MQLSFADNIIQPLAAVIKIFSRYRLLMNEIKMRLRCIRFDLPSSY